ncbi:cyclic nucleotide-binding domain-containing protein, partial [Staphylococcus epidermidis]|uniref:cyclic nucleotide-binding domain-containing protein n=1 Tax=Staphylococcus epidermidis TaxID=1282 RepID=UPI0011A52C66
PFKSQCFVSDYSNGQVIYFSSDETTHIYLLIGGNIMRESFNLNGDVYRYLNREKVLFPLNNLFQDKAPNEMCTALTNCEVIGIPKDLIEYLCKNHEDIFVRLFELLSATQC